MQYLGQLHAKSQLQVSIVLQQNWSEESKSCYVGNFCLALALDIRFDFLLRANRSLFLQERTGHLGAQPVETRVYPNYFSSSQPVFESSLFLRPPF